MHLYRFIYLHITSGWGGDIQSHKAVFACVRVYTVVGWIIIQTSPVLVVSVLLTVANPLLTGLTILCWCIHCVDMCAHVSMRF